MNKKNIYILFIYYILYIKKLNWIFVIAKQDLSEPKIVKDTLRHVVRGQTLRVNCTIDLKERSGPFQLYWKIPVEVCLLG